MRCWYLCPCSGALSPATLIVEPCSCCAAGLPVLVAFNAGATARTLEQRWSNEQMLARVMGVLRKVYDDVPDPVSYIVTRWASDPYSLGSYSFLAKGATPQDRDRWGCSCWRGRNSVAL